MVLNYLKKRGKMPIYISHRGNLNSVNKEIENHPDQIEKVIDLGYFCEIDLWYINGCFYLGHDEPQYVINYEFLNNTFLFIHCKNIEALYELNKRNQFFADYFFHNQDDVVLTAEKKLWSYPRKSVILTDQSIAVMPELVDGWENLDKCYGICTDYPEKYKEKYGIIL
jgi:hypothetical protein